MENSSVIEKKDELKPVSEETRLNLVKLVKVKAAMEEAKALYEEYDRLTMELQKTCGTGCYPVVLTEEESMSITEQGVKFIAKEQVVTLVDNFLEKNVVFRPAAVKRYEVLVEDLGSFTQKQDKKAKKSAKGA